jgi:hypothetical protein
MTLLRLVDISDTLNKFDRNRVNENGWFKKCGQIVKRNSDKNTTLSITICGLYYKPMMIINGHH